MRTVEMKLKKQEGNSPAEEIVSRLTGLDGVEKVDVAGDLGSLVMDFDPKKMDLATINIILDRLGYDVENVEDKTAAGDDDTGHVSDSKRVWGIQ